MKLALKAKRKLGFIIGDCKKESFENTLHEEWETYNAIVHSWIMNSVSKDLVSGIIYASDAHAVWEDLKERFDKVNRVRISRYTEQFQGYHKELTLAKEHIVHLHQQRLMKFRNGLNDTYDQARMQILMKTNEPTLNQAYALISQDESQQAMGNLSRQKSLILWLLRGTNERKKCALIL
ncbi:uncharacterized protein LOC142167113 [Nicotiana tabacum]|uniref:Uncharacterized protein LOC142167113 n=1 Tax=Nicotiana tabacum TaxID=4097 RepID=A0AC58SEG8_TOBAC